MQTEEINHAATISKANVAAYTIPTDFPESDGTLKWDSTTMILVSIEACGKTGIGYSYADLAAATLIRKKLLPLINNKNAFDIPARWQEMIHAVRNLGRPGIASMAIAAVDNALWDLKSRLLNMPLCRLLGMCRDSLEIYGSGGFTSYDNKQLQNQLAGWVDEGMTLVKMKIGREPENDLNRVKAALEAIGKNAHLMVDANGAYDRKQALAFAEKFADLGVVWFEEPVTHDDRGGLCSIRNQGPAGLEISAGEYGYRLSYFQRLINEEAVDVLQADATRCGGISGFLKTGALCEAHYIPFSSHCAPALHLHAGLSSPAIRHAEYFHDHVRIENMLFEGVPQPKDGYLYPDLSRPGMGLSLKKSEAKKYKVE